MYNDNNGHFVNWPSSLTFFTIYLSGTYWNSAKNQGRLSASAKLILNIIYKISMKEKTLARTYLLTFFQSNLNLDSKWSRYPQKQQSTEGRCTQVFCANPKQRHCLSVAEKNKQALKIQMCNCTAIVQLYFTSCLYCLLHCLKVKHCVDDSFSWLYTLSKCSLIVATSYSKTRKFKKRRLSIKPSGERVAWLALQLSTWQFTQKWNRIWKRKPKYRTQCIAWMVNHCKTLATVYQILQASERIFSTYLYLNRCFHILSISSP